MIKISVKQRISLVILGILLCLIILEVGLSLTSSFISVFLEKRRSNIYIKNAEYRIMCLGDSTTFFGGENSYPAQLERILNEANLGIRFRVINEGIPGGNSALVLSKLDENLKEHNPDMVVAMIGLNDTRGTFKYEDTSSSKIRLFLEEFRIYKLTRLLWWHIVNKIDEIKISKSREKKNIKPQKNNLLKSASDNNLDYVNLGYSYFNQGFYEESESIFKKAIEMNPDNYTAYIGLNELFMKQHKYDEAELVFKKAIEIYPNNDRIMLLGGNLYNKKGLYEEAESIFKKAIEINSKIAYKGIGQSYYHRRRYRDAEEMYGKAIEVNSNDYWAYILLGQCLFAQRKFDKAEKILNEAIEIEANNFMGYDFLAYCYIDKREYTKAEEMLKKALKLAPVEFKSIAELGLFDCYKNQGKNEELREIYKCLVHNYRKIKTKIVQKGVRFVCVQYPVLEIRPLKIIFNSDIDITFVDNEKIFKDALQYGRYEDYFTDNIGGVFGHCTVKGNRILAENIANTILKKYFANKFD